MLPPQRVYKIACDITQALGAAAERNLLHRNIKPDSILLTAKGTAKLSNFTLARGIVMAKLDEITRSGELVGDLAYMAPERAEPDSAPDCRSDMYALGACLYHVLTGRPPFAGRGTVHLLQCIRNDAPKPPSKLNLSVPATLESLVLKCLAKSPSDRYSSPQELAAELVRIGRFQGLAG